MVNRFLTVGVCLIAMSAAMNAQERLSLADATGRALEKNYAIRVERENVAAAESRTMRASGVYDVQMRLDVNARHHRDPINSLFSGAPDGRPAPSQNSFGSTVTFS